MNSDSMSTLPVSPYHKIHQIFKVIFTTTILSTLLFLAYSFSLNTNTSPNCTFLCISSRDLMLWTTLYMSAAVHACLIGIYIWLLIMAYCKRKFNLSGPQILIAILLQALVGAGVWYYMSLLHY